MTRILDPRLDDILATRTCAGLPPAVTHPAYSLLRKLLASRSWGDVAVFTRVAALSDGLRYAAPVEGKWAIVFTWSPAFGASDLALQRF